MLAGARRLTCRSTYTASVRNSLLVSARQLQAHVRRRLAIPRSWLSGATALRSEERRVGKELTGVVEGPNSVWLAVLVLLNSRSTKTPYITPQEIGRCLLQLDK